MSRLDDTTADELRAALDSVAAKKPTQRLMVAIAYKHGVPQTDLADWYGVRRGTVHNWLARIEDEPLPDAVRDDRRSGRPRKLDGEQRERALAAVREPPSESGYDAATWTPKLVAQFLDAEFGVTYSPPSCRRLMRDAGLTYRKRGNADGSAGQGDDAGATYAWLP